ncbi:MAG: bifunctional precorrin-2 dehydrogenase/sirohydrochlorin ferrochelatase [bacterium]
MYMPLMIDLERVVVFGGEREEGLQKTEKLAVFADELIVVPESNEAPEEIVLEQGPLNRVPESLELAERRVIPIHEEPVATQNIPELIEGATFVTSDLEDEQLNQRIAEVCERKNILCNIIDVKELCNTWLMSVVDTPNIIAGLSTKGGCAFYSQRTRVELEEEFEHRSGVSKIFTELRNGLREDQCNLCTLDIVYKNEDMKEILEKEDWKKALEVGQQLAKSVPDDHHVMDHSVETL